MAGTAIERDRENEWMGESTIAAVGLMLLCTIPIIVLYFVPSKYQKRARVMTALSFTVILGVLSHYVVETPGHSIDYLLKIIRKYLTSFLVPVLGVTFVTAEMMGRRHIMTRWLLPLTFALTMVFLLLRALHVTDALIFLHHVYSGPLLAAPTWPTASLLAIQLAGPTVFALCLAQAGLLPTAFPLPELSELKKNAKRLVHLTNDWANLAFLLGAADITVFLVVPAALPRTWQPFALYISIAFLSFVRYFQGPEEEPPSGPRIAFILIDESVHVLSMAMLNGGLFVHSLPAVLAVGACSRLGGTLAYNFITRHAEVDDAGANQAEEAEADPQSAAHPADEPQGLGDPLAEPDAGSGNAPSPDHGPAGRVPGAWSLTDTTSGCLRVIVDGTVSMPGEDDDGSQGEMVKLETRLTHLTRASHVTGLLFARALAAGLAVSLFSRVIIHT